MRAFGVIEFFGIAPKTVVSGTFVYGRRLECHGGAAQLGDPQTEIWASIQPATMKFDLISEEIDPSRFLEPANDWSTEEVEQEVAAWREANM